MSTSKRTPHKKLSVIIVTHNNGKHIRSCLHSLKENFQSLNMSNQIIVIDNTSSDDTVEIIQKYRDIDLVKNKKNAGFAKGVNCGIKRACGNLLLILNPDTKLHKNSLVKLVQCLEKTNSGIVGGMVYKPDGSLHGSFVRKPTLGTVLFDYSNLRKIIPGDIFHKKHYYEDLGCVKNATRVDAVSGAYMLIDNSVIKNVGMLDEKFFMYLEDVDFCVRASTKGYKIMLCPESKIIHVGGASSKNKDRINHNAWSESRKYYTRKHFGELVNLIAQPIFIIDDLMMTLWRKIK